MKWFLNDSNNYDIVFSNAVLHWLDSDEDNKRRKCKWINSVIQGKKFCN